MQTHKEGHDIANFSLLLKVLETTVRIIELGFVIRELFPHEFQLCIIGTDNV